MTINQALITAEEYIDKEFLPSRSTIYGWIRAGIISSPVRREILGRGKGTRDIYPETLSKEIASVAAMKHCGLNNKAIKFISEPAFKELTQKYLKVYIEMNNKFTTAH